MSVNENFCLERVFILRLILVFHKLPVQDAQNGKLKQKRASDLNPELQIPLVTCYENDVEVCLILGSPCLFESELAALRFKNDTGSESDKR